MSGSSRGHSPFVRAIGPTARDLFGEPNKRLSSSHELRFGKHGSLAVDLREGIWFDHERNRGGGVIDLVIDQLGGDKASAIAWLKERNHLPLSPRERQSGRKIIATYDYVDETGKLLYQVCRYCPKDFLQRQPVGEGGWRWSTEGTRKILYRLPEVLRAIAEGDFIWVVEGEKAADALWQRGAPATCPPGGAGKWRPEYAKALTGSRAVVLPDADQTGEEHADDVLASLISEGCDAVKLVLPNLPHKGDELHPVSTGHRP